ncbi:MAG TPA: CHAD domain-containing protein [Opitutaceae bacterium]|nr:CHAD domain-containing protein [Opitutaceae bacterium]
MGKHPHRDPLPRLQPGEALGPGLGRVVRACLLHAAGGPAARPDEKIVHRARQALKRARAVVRVAEELEVGGAVGARRRLTQLGRELSPLRDAAIVGQVGRELAKRNQAEEQRAVAALPASARSVARARGWSAWQRRLRAEGARLQELDWGELTTRDLERVLRRGTKRIRRCAKAARREKDIPSAHEWRKAVIILREQVRVLRPLLGSEAAHLQADLHRLAHRLGQAIDLHVFLIHVQGRSWPTNLRKGMKRLARRGKRERGRALRRALKDR